MYLYFVDNHFVSVLPLKSIVLAGSFCLCDFLFLGLADPNLLGNKASVVVLLPLFLFVFIFVLR